MQEKRKAAEEKMITQETQTVAELLIKCLEQEGVEYIFGIPGEENLAVMNAIEKSSIKFITTRHEQGAAFMADVYGRLTGKAGVCLSTLGPGATNLVTGVADAHSDGSPLIALTGQVGTDRMHITSHQFLDLCKMFEPITKRVKMIVNPSTVNEIVRIAFKYAESEKPGACHIDLPVNVASMDAGDEKPLMKKISTKEYAEGDSVEKAADQIFMAERPVVLVGSGAIRGKASEALTALVTDLHIPAVVTMMSKGAVPFDNPYALGTIGIPQKDYPNKIIENADLIITVGYDIVEYAPVKWNDANKIKIIHIDTRPAHINKLYQPIVEVIGDISDSLHRIRRRTLKPKNYVYAQKIRKKMIEEASGFANDTSYPMKPQKILWDVRKVMGDEDILISDVGAHKMWIARHYPCYRPNTCIISNGFATMGIGVPGAISAKLIHPDRKVLTITGDGGFMMNSQELETALRIGTPIVVLIFNDNHYGLIKWKQMDKFGHSCYVDFTNPDFVKYAESMGAKGYRIEKADELIPALEEAFLNKVPSVIDCPVDYSENEKLTKHLEKIYREN